MQTGGRQRLQMLPSWGWRIGSEGQKGDAGPGAGQRRLGQIARRPGERDDGISGQGLRSQTSSLLRHLCRELPVGEAPTIP